MLMTTRIRQFMSLLLVMMAAVANGQTLLDNKFETVAEFEKYTVINSNEDWLTWHYDDLLLAACCDRDYDADDWLVTPALALTEGKTYRLTFSANIDQEDTEILSVMLGEAATADELVTPLMENVEVTSTSRKEYTTTFKATDSGNFYIGFHLSTTGSMYSNYFYLTSVRVEETADQGVPAAITNLTITPDASGALKATIAFNAPTKSIGGDALSAITKIEVFRDNTLVKTFDNPAVGSSLSFEDTGMTNGYHTYRIVPTNAMGEGDAVEQQAYVGFDEPGPVTNVRFVYNYDTKKSTITWDAPTVGKNGGYISTEGITYSIRRFHAADPVATGVTATTFEDEVDIDFLLAEEERTREQYAEAGMPVNVTYVVDGEGLMQYYVQAQLANGKSAEAVSNSVIIGEAKELPYFESFPEGKLTHYWRTDIRNKRARWGAMASTLFCQDGDGGMMGFGAIEGEETGMCHTGNINMKDAVSPILTFYYFAEYAMQMPLIVKVSKDGGDFEQIASIPLDDESMKYRYNRVSVPLTGCAGHEHVMVAFESTTATTVDNLFIDNVRIIDQRQHDLKATLASKPNYLKVGEKRNVTVNVENLGTDDVATREYTIDLYVNNAKVASSTGLAIESEELKSYLMAVEGNINMERESEIYAEVVYEQDEMTDNNRSDVEIIGVKMPLYPEATNLTLTQDATGALLSWQQPSAPRTEDGLVTDSFEDYPDFERFGFGDWMVYDGDQRMTWGIGNHHFPMNSDVQSFMIWNPSEVTNDTGYNGGKGIANQAWYPRTGNKSAISFSAATDEVNCDDWLISPELSGHEQIISFYAHSLATASAPDQFSVCVSTTGNDHTNFLSIDATPKTATSEWKLYEYIHPEGTKYFAIHKTTHNGWAFLVDDITFAPDTLAATPDIMLYGYNVYKNGKRLNTALVSTPTFTDNNPLNGDVYQVTAVYDAGESVYSNRVVYQGDGATAIESIATESAQGNDRLYDLQGRKVNSLPQRGIVISNHRKVIVK